MTQEHLSSQLRPPVEREAYREAAGDAGPAVRPARARRRALGIVLALLLALATVAAYVQAFSSNYVNYDDNEYVYFNPHVQAGLNWDNVWWAITNTETVNWYPLTWLSLMLDSTMCGGIGRPGGFHATNVVLHTANTVLLFWVLTRMTGRLGRSAVVAGLFALHPLHVESVAWITERKDVLSGFFWMLALAAYVWYARRPGWLKYLLVVLLFALGLTAKSMLVTLPGVLFLLDFWPLRRYPPQTRRDAADAGPEPAFRAARVSWLRLIAEKVPLVALSAASTAITLYAQQKGGESNPLGAMPLRIGNALISYATYIGKTVWPVGLVPYYPFPKDAREVYLSPAEAVMAGLLLLAVTVLVLGSARRRPYLAVGWLWFLWALAPVIGVIQVIGDYARADRFTYIPLIGLFLAAVWAAGDALARAKVWPWLAGTGAVLVLAGFTAGTWQQVGYWHDGKALWHHTLEVNPKNHLAWNNLAHIYMSDADVLTNKIWDDQRRGAGVVAAATRAGLPAAPFGQGPLLEASTLVSGGSPCFPLNQEDVRTANEGYEEAERLFRKAYECDSSFALSHITLGYMLEKLGRGKEAAKEHESAADLDSNNAWYQYKAGDAILRYLDRGRLQDAISYLEKAVQINPDYFDAQLDLGWALFDGGDLDGSVQHLREALRIVSSSATAHDWLGRALLAQGDRDGAVAEFKKAIDGDPGYAEAHDWLGEAYRREGKLADWEREREESQRLRERAELERPHTCP